MLKYFKFLTFVYLFIFSVFTFKDLLKNDQDNVPKEVSEKYYISRVLGQGACGVVKLVYDKVGFFYFFYFQLPICLYLNKYDIVMMTSVNLITINLHILIIKMYQSFLIQCLSR